MIGQLKFELKITLIIFPKQKIIKNNNLKLCFKIFLPLFHFVLVVALVLSLDATPNISDTTPDYDDRCGDGNSDGDWDCNNRWEKPACFFFNLCRCLC